MFYNGVIIKKNTSHKITVRSEAERVVDYNLPVCHPLTEIMGVQHYRPYGALLLGSHPSRVVLCVFVFFPFSLDVRLVGRASRGHTERRSHRISHPPSFCGACLNFSREKDSAVPFPRRP